MKPSRLKRPPTVPTRASRPPRVRQHCACAYGQLKVLNWLYEEKLRMDEPDAFGWQPVHYASANGHLPLLQV